MRFSWSVLAIACLGVSVQALPKTTSISKLLRRRRGRRKRAPPRVQQHSQQRSSETITAPSGPQPTLETTVSVTITEAQSSPSSSSASSASSSTLPAPTVTPVSTATSVQTSIQMSSLYLESTTTTTIPGPAQGYTVTISPSSYSNSSTSTSQPIIKLDQQQGFNHFKPQLLQPPHRRRAPREHQVRVRRSQHTFINVQSVVFDGIMHRYDLEQHFGNQLSDSIYSHRRLDLYRNSESDFDVRLRQRAMAYNVSCQTRVDLGAGLELECDYLIDTHAASYQTDCI